MEDPLFINSVQDVKPSLEALEKSFPPDENTHSSPLQMGTIYLWPQEFCLKFECSFCGKLFKNINLYLKHSLHHTWQSLVHWQNELEEGKSQILFEKSLENEEVIEENLNNFEINEVFSIKEELKEEQNSGNLEFSSYHEEDQHFLDHIKPEDVQEFISRSSEDSDSDSSISTCSKDDDSLVTELMKTKRNSLGNEYYCKTCCTSFPSQSLCSNHECCDIQKIIDLVQDEKPSSQQNVSSERKKKFFCYDCKRVYCLRSSLRSHYLKVHSAEGEQKVKQLLEEEQSKSEFSEPTAWICPFCGKHCTSKISLKNHKYYSHTRKSKNEQNHLEKEIVSDQTSGTNATAAPDEFALKLDKTLENLCVCGTCKKSFANRVTLKNHLLNYHSSERRYKCEFCDYSCKTTTNLNVHRARHLGLKRFACQHCEKRFTSSTEVKIHEKIHSKEKGFVCEVCAKSFYTSSKLKAHQQSHAAERTFKCNLCEKSFFTKQCLYSHTAGHSNERRFKCTECDKSFNYQKGLNQHKKLHSDVYSYKCQFCEKSFRQGAGLWAHVKYAHKNCDLLSSKEKQ